MNNSLTMPRDVINDEASVVEPLESLPPRQKMIAVFSLSSCTFLIAIETTMTAIISPEIRKQFGADLDAGFAIATIYLLGAATFQPVWAELSHALGRKSILMAGLLIYIAGSIIAVNCRSLTPLYVARALQGVGGAAPTAIPSMVLADMFPLTKRTVWQQVLNLLWAVGSILGPVIGGFILNESNDRWRYALWLEFGLAILSLIAVGFGLNSNWPKGRVMRALRKVDWIGILLTIPTILLCFFPLTCGGSLFQWHEWPIITSLLVGYMVFIPLLICHQRFWRINPMFRKELFRNRTLVTGFVGALASGSLLWMLLMYLTFFYKYVRKLPAIWVAIYVLPETLTFVPTLLMAAFVIKRYKKYRWANIAGWSMTTLGFGLLQLLKRIQADAETVAINAVTGIGLGILFAGLIPTIQAAVDPRFKAHATSMTILMRSAGQALGVAIGGTILTCHLKPSVELFGLGDPLDIVDGLDPGGGDFPSGLGEGTRMKITESLEYSLKPVWIFGCVVAGVMAVAMGSLRVAPLSDDPVHECEGHVSTIEGVVDEGGKDTGVWVLPRFPFDDGRSFMTV
ncbi:putative Major facilitator superfamily (MFS) profile domain-containing protein [Seiridium unicorne]|uniref:Major facilitator superfamily (MFS) profile domain-containing protein n=1 Tax=Seiridium unicorne TaxID=138068 RepID=A0ABR2UNA9_9PEZI